MASTPGVFSVQQFTDLGGPLVGGRLYTYTYGTTAQKVAYTDINGAIPHTYTSDGVGGQYIALNARGELPAPLYLVSGSYDLALKRSDGSTVWTRRADPVSDAFLAQTGAGLVGFLYSLGYASGTLGKWLKDLALGAGSTFIGWVQTSSTTVQTISDRLRFGPPIVTDFGAVLNVSTTGQRTANSAALLATIGLNRTAEIPAGTLWIDTNTALSGFWHIKGAGSAATTIKGDGDLFSITAADNGEMRRVAHLTILNDTTKGKLFKYAGAGASTNRVEFDHVNFGNSNYHIHSSGGDAVNWTLSHCRRIGAAIESLHFEGLWAFTDINPYAWFNTIGLRCTNGNVFGCNSYGGSYEQNDDSGIVLEGTAAYEVDGFNFWGTEVEANGKLTNNGDFAFATTAATRIRNVNLIGIGFGTPTATQTVRVSSTEGGGGSITINIDRPSMLGTVALCTNVSRISVSDMYGQVLGVPSNVTVPVKVTSALSGKFLGSESVTGAQAGSSAVTATSGVIPTGTKMAVVSVQGNYYNTVANTHTGSWEGRYYASASRISFKADDDVNNGAGANQGFVVTVVGGAIQVANKAAMTNTQSGDLVVSYWG